MPRFLILIHGDDSEFSELPPDQAQEAIAALRPFEETVAREGSLLGTHRLHPSSESILVRIREGKPSIIDGPFTESKEQLGGYYLIEAHDLDQVLTWMRLIPPVMDSTLEVRRVVDEERSLP